MKNKQVKFTKLDNLIWIIISIIEWLSIPLLLDIIGVDINFSLYNDIILWKYFDYLFYLLIITATLGFSYFSIKFAILKFKKEKIIAEISFIIQILLILFKSKI